LTTVDGLLDASGKRIAEIKGFRNISKLVRPGEKGNLSKGGMSSKLKAVRAAVQSGIDTWIANGRRSSLVPIFAGRNVGTFFPASTVG
jgi:glutamate 5-kinase